MEMYVMEQPVLPQSYPERTNRRVAPKSGKVVGVQNDVRVFKGVLEL